MLLIHIILILLCRYQPVVVVYGKSLGIHTLANVNTGAQKHFPEIHFPPVSVIISVCKMDRHKRCIMPLLLRHSYTRNMPQDMILSQSFVKM